MNKVIVDQTMLEKLRELKEPADLCDEHGRVVGYFRPATDESLYKQVVPPISEEELDRLEKEGGGRPLADIMRDLEKNT